MCSECNGLSAYIRHPHIVVVCGLIAQIDMGLLDLGLIHLRQRPSLRWTCDGKRSPHHFRGLSWVMQYAQMRCLDLGHAFTDSWLKIVRKKSRTRYCAG